MGDTVNLLDLIPWWQCVAMPCSLDYWLYTVKLFHPSISIGVFVQIYRLERQIQLEVNMNEEGRVLCAFDISSCCY